MTKTNLWWHHSLGNTDPYFIISFLKKKVTHFTSLVTRHSSLCHFFCFGVKLSIQNPLPLPPLEKWRRWVRDSAAPPPVTAPPRCSAAPSESGRRSGSTSPPLPYPTTALTLTLTTPPPPAALPLASSFAVGLPPPSTTPPEPSPTSLPEESSVTPLYVSLSMTLHFFCLPFCFFGEIFNWDFVLWWKVLIFVPVLC